MKNTTTVFTVKGVYRLQQRLRKATRLAEELDAAIRAVQETKIEVVQTT